MQRANQKLCYAEIHLEELRNYPKAFSNDDWEDAHQESVLYHLAGAVDALLHEINDGYSLGLNQRQVKWEHVKNKLQQSSQSSPAFNHLQQLREDDRSWLSLLLEWRNYQAHNKRIPKFVQIGMDNEFRDPRTGKEQTVYPGKGCSEVLNCLAEDVKELIAYCRSIDPKLKP